MKWFGKCSGCEERDRVTKDREAAWSQTILAYQADLTFVRDLLAKAQAALAEREDKGVTSRITPRPKVERRPVETLPHVKVLGPLPGNSH